MAITTVYNGIEYRSRLEARWAAFMQNIGWEIVYEPFDGDGYIPDFLVQGPRPFLVEVKPAVTLAEYEAAVPKAEKGLAKHWRHDILIVGASPLPSIECSTDSWNPVVAGWLGQYQEWIKEPGYWWATCTWGDDCGCNKIGICHDLGGYHRLPCDCYNGNNGHMSNRHLLESFWADACNDVKWRGTEGKAVRANPRPPEPKREPRRLSDLAPLSHGAEKLDLKVGEFVNHPTFGYGTVVKLTGLGTDQPQIVVNFSVGDKRMLLKYAPLTRSATA